MSWQDKLKDLFFEEKTGDISESKAKKIDLTEITSNISTIFKEKYTYYFALILVLLLGFWIRIQNLDLLRNKFLLGLDPYSYFRYASEILEAGKYAAVDVLREAPIGTIHGFDLFPYFLAAWDRLIISFGQTQMFAHIIYPAVFGVIGFIFFFLFVKEVFDIKVALLATAFLAVMPAYLFRTLSGFADHEALAMMFMFAALWTFVLAFKSEKLKQSLILAVISGLLTFCMAMSWIGFGLLTIPISLFAFVVLIFNKTNKNFIYVYSCWFMIFVIPFLLIEGWRRISSIGSIMPLLAFVGIVVYYSLYKAKLKEYLPQGLQAVILTIIITLVVGISTKIVDLEYYLALLSQPAETSGRVAQTISEIIGSTNLFSAYSWFLYLCFLGTLFLIYMIFSENKKAAVTFCGISLVFFVPAMFKKYSIQTYQHLLIITLILAAAAYLYFYYRDKDWLKSVNILLVLPLTYLILFTYLAKSAARFLFVLAPIIALFTAYLLVKLAEGILDYQDGKFKWAIIIIAMLALFLFVPDAQTTAQQASATGSNLPGTWNEAFAWIRENTPEDSVITHWWDYGYWTQTVGERASTHDGGTHSEYPLYILGRYAMTAPNPIDALTFFKTYRVNYLLYSEEEIGKYHAFSYIGSDKDLDRRSTIGVFGLQEEQEIRNGTRLVYGGQWGSDEDYVINSRVYPEGESVILGFTIDKQVDSLTNPIAYLAHGSKAPVQLPIGCVCFNDICKDVKAQNVLDGCLVIIPFVRSQTEANEMGGALYLSKKVKDGLFARLYIKGEKLEGFEKVYYDGVPLVIYRGRVIGPKVIWKITPPAYIEEKPILLWNNTEIYGYEKDFRRNFE